MSSSATPVEPRDAATVLLVRDGDDGVEVFMVVRHKRIEFASGALVFPGGSVDPADRSELARARVPAAEGALETDTLALRVAAVREAYEECGVLLARPRGSADLIDGERLAGIDERHATARAAHDVNLGAIADAEDLEIASDLLVPFARWITPAPRPKRFDTWFYLAPAPADQVAIHDGHESVDSVWRTPRKVMAEADAGRWQLMFPTRMNLEKLARSETVADAFVRAREAEIVTVMPAMERVEGGRLLRIPREAGYGLTEVVVDEKGLILRRE